MSGQRLDVLKDIAPETLAAAVITELISRTGISGTDIDDVILGQASPNGEAPALGRVAALDAGLGIDVPDNKSTAAADPDYKQSCRPACKFRPEAVTSSSPAARKA